MVSGLIGIQVPGNRLWVRIPCPPLSMLAAALKPLGPTATFFALPRLRGPDVGNPVVHNGLQQW